MYGHALQLVVFHTKLPAPIRLPCTGSIRSRSKRLWTCRLTSFFFSGSNLRVSCRIRTIFAARGISWRTALVKLTSWCPLLNTSLYSQSNCTIIGHSLLLLHYLHTPPQWSAKIVDTSELYPGHNYCRLAKVYKAPMLHQEWHPKNGVFLELANDERLTNCLTSDSTSKLNDAIKGNAWLVCQRAIFPLVQSAFSCWVCRRVNVSTAL